MHYNCEIDTDVTVPNVQADLRFGASTYGIFYWMLDIRKLLAALYAAGIGYGHNTGLVEFKPDIALKATSFGLEIEATRFGFGKEKTVYLTDKFSFFPHITIYPKFEQLLYLSVRELL